MSGAPLLPPLQWQGLACEWLWVYRGVSPRVRQWSGEIMVPPGVFFVESGRVQIQAAGKTLDVPAGHAFLSAPGPRRQWFEENTRLLSVGLRCHWPDGRPLYVQGLNVALPGTQVQSLLQASRRLYTTVHGRRKSVSYAQGTLRQPRSLAGWAQHEAAFRQWFAAYVESLASLKIAPTPQQGPGDRRLEQLRHWLLGWPLDRPLDLGPAEHLTGLSRRRVHDLLREGLGMTAQTYLERRRLAHARQRLTQEDIALKEIAFSLGFRHAPHFTAWFRRHAGITPTACRQGTEVEAA